MNDKKIHVLQLITPVGFYGAERWILALINNSDHGVVRHDLAVTVESLSQNLEITDYYPQDAGGETFRVEMTGRFDWSVVRKLSELVDQRRIDMIHTHGYKSDIIGTIVARRKGITCISTPHGFGQIEGFKLRLFVRLGVFSFQFMNRVVPLSDQLNRELIEYGVDRKKLMLIHNGVDLKEVDEVYHAPQTQAPQAEVIRLGYIGRFDDNKNVADIIRVFDRLWANDQRLELCLIGDGATRTQLEALVSTLPSQSAVRFLGFRNDRLEWLKTFSMFLMSSKNEGIPRCIMEAMGMNVPVVAYDITGVAQLITHEQTGLLARFGDVEGMAAQCARLLADEKFSQDIAHNARLFVDECYSARRMAKEYLLLYREVLDGN
jgi:glycosyltransferase involved in cell wall biosynthesis